MPWTVVGLEVGGPSSGLLRGDPLEWSWVSPLDFYLETTKVRVRGEGRASTVGRNVGGIPLIFRFLLVCGRLSEVLFLGGFVRCLAPAEAPLSIIRPSSFVVFIVINYRRVSSLLYGVGTWFSSHDKIPLVNLLFFRPFNFRTLVFVL